MPAEMSQLLQVDVPVGLFVSNWANSDLLATYVARIVSVGRSDPAQFANMFSSVLNELLEVVYFNSAGAGVVGCAVLREGELDRIALKVPCSPAARDFYLNVRESLRADDSAQRYEAALLADGPVDRRLGFWELAADYKARIDIEPDGEADMTLTVDLVLETETA